MDILADKWIPTPSSFTTRFPFRGIANRRVASLILPNGEWNRQEISNYFHVEDMQPILNILLLKRRMEDSSIWNYSEDGNFPVKKCYLFASEDLITGGQSNNQEMLRWWTELWIANISSKIKVFGWKANKDFLPTGVCLVIGARMWIPYVFGVVE